MSVWRSVHSTPAVESLRRQIAKGEIVHAWLLVGPAGAGKVATAAAMGAAINCPVEPFNGCGSCSTCLRILRHRHPDVHHVSAEGTFIHVDTIRSQVVAEASRSAFEASFKVFIVEEAERMNDAAQNSLLKTLEEPEGNTVFILVSAREEELLDTIKSRCRAIRLERMTEHALIAALEEEGAPQDVAMLSARVAEGDMARARELAFDPSAQERRSVWLGIPRRITSAVDALDLGAEIVAESKGAVRTLEAQHKTELVELAESIGEGRGSATARNALVRRHKRELKRREEDILEEALVTLASFYRDALAARTHGDEAIANLDYLEEIRSWAAAGVPDLALLQAVERCVTARGALTRNSNVALTLEATLLALSRLVPTEARVGAGA